MLHAFVVGWVFSTVVLAALLLAVVVVQRLAAAVARVETRAAAEPAPTESRSLSTDYATAS